ncbi:MAG: hypothetical protein NTY90_03020 [Candidatus Micrarchaeota archaeon]|nr:hypothetical protein [Candidatus Micrarchaeota archaeon]
MDKPRIVAIKEKTLVEAKEGTGETPATGAQETEMTEPVPRKEVARGPPWVVREAIEARKKALPEAAEKIIEEQAKDIIPTVPELGEPVMVKKKGLAGRLLGWVFK